MAGACSIVVHKHMCEIQSETEDRERNGLGWFALRVKPNHEKKVSFSIADRGFEEFLPLYPVRKWTEGKKDVQAPLFPGYVFCKFDRSSWVPVIRTPGVIDVVRCGKSPAGIADEEIASLQQVHRLRATMEPWPYLKTGQTVNISAGPLAGVSGTLVEVKRLVRLVLSVSLLQRSVLVEVDREWVI
jgi:transcription antitermination factor NusG